MSFSRSAERGELLIESEARSAESSEAKRSEAPSLDPMSRRTRAGRCESRSGFIYIYILFDGLARNTGQYFTSCGRIFPSPVGARKNASNE